MVDEYAFWLRHSVVEPVMNAKAGIKTAMATDLIVGVDAFYQISNSLRIIGSAASQGFLKTELDNSFYIADLGATVAGLQVWRSEDIASNTMEVWAATHRSLESRPFMQNGKAQLTVPDISKSDGALAKSFLKNIAG